MPVRFPPKNRRSVTGLVASVKNNTMRAHESTLERDLLFLLEFDLNVHTYEEQPVRIEFRDSDGHLHTYTPDVLVTYRKDIAPAKQMPPLLCEVKYRKDLFADWKRLKPKFKAARCFAREKGWRFSILTEHEIRTPLLENARFLLPYRKLEMDWEQSQLLLQMLGELREATPESLLLACGKELMERARLIPMLWHLVSIGMIGADLNIRLVMHSPIWTMV
ncbi:MAG: TnsA endonuclease N-terminal domain-containing protein [Acidobacteriota bacterium]|nr:TnsA endonuclease N-terminal domain-containing protein [Acidobacteriota bacterium]